MNTGRGKAAAAQAPPGQTVQAPPGDPHPEQHAAAYQACEVENPLPPPELDPSRNPEYHQDMKDWVDCMNDQGMKVTIVPDGWTYTGESHLGHAQQGAVEQDCKVEAFGGTEK
jgi:hypothetical protein